MKKELPFFKYHPDPLKTGTFETNETVSWDWWGKETDGYYSGPFYSVEVVEYLCLDLFIQLKMLNIYVLNV